MQGKNKAYTVLALNTIAFNVCFAAWMLNGVLVTFLVDNRIFDWNPAQIGVLIGIPVLTGSIMRLPLGVLTDKFGGRPVYAILMLLSAIPMYMLGQANSYSEYLIYSLGFGMTAYAHFNPAMLKVLLGAASVIVFKAISGSRDPMGIC